MTDHITKIREALEARDKASAELDAALDEGDALKIDRAFNAYDKAQVIFNAVANDGGIRSLLAALDEAQKKARLYDMLASIPSGTVRLDPPDSFVPQYLHWTSRDQFKSVVDAAIAAQEGGKDG